MADNIELDAGSGGATVAADDVGGVHYQVVKLDVGADGLAAPVSNSNPVPVSDAGGTLTVDGTVAVTHAALTELAAAINGSSQMDVNIAASNATVTVDLGANNDVTVTGTVDLGATDNAVLDAIAASLGTLDNAISGNEMQVDVLTMPTVTINSPAVTNAGTFVVQENGAALTALQLLDNSVYVDDADWTDNTSSHLLVGGVYQSTQHTVTDGDVSPLAVDENGNLRVNIVAGAAAGGTSVADDADFTDGTTALTPIGGVYESSPSSVTDGDIGMAGITETRSLKVHISGSDVATGGTSAADDADFTAGTTPGTPVMGVYDSTPDNVTDGDLGTIGITQTRAVRTVVEGTAVVDLGANNDVTVTGTVDLGATDNAVLDAIAASLALLDNSIAAGNELQVDVVAALPAGTNNIGDVDVLTIAAGDNNIGNVDIVTMPSVTLAASTGTQEVVGDVAHDAAAAGNPVQTGGYATNAIEGVTQVAAGDLTRTVHDLNGVQVVRPHTTLEEIQSVRTTNTDGASTSLVAAAGAGVHNYLSNITIWNSSATDGFVDLRDGTGGAVMYTLPAPQTGGCTVSFPVPLKFGDNTAIAFDASGAISTIYISAVFFQAQG